MPDLFTADISRQTGASSSTIGRWIVSGLALPDGRRLRLQATRAGGRWKCHPDHLQAFLDAMTAAHAPPEPAGAGRGRRDRLIRKPTGTTSDRQ